MFMICIKRLTGVHDLHQTLDWTVLVPPSSAAHGRSSMPLSSAAWTTVTVSLDPRVLFTFVLYNPSLNAAVLLIIKRRKLDRITDALRDEVHWLPVQYRHLLDIQVSAWNCCIVLCRSQSRQTLHAAVYSLLSTATSCNCSQTWYTIIRPA